MHCIRAGKDLRSACRDSQRRTSKVCCEIEGKERIQGIQQTGLPSGARGSSVAGISGISEQVTPLGCFEYYDRRTKAFKKTKPKSSQTQEKIQFQMLCVCHALVFFGEGCLPIERGRCKVFCEPLEGSEQLQSVRPM